MIFYLHTTSLLDGIRPDDLAKTHETLKLLAEEAGIDLKDPDNGKVREHVKNATKLIMERTGLIEKQEDGTYRIPNEQLYKDTIYTISLRLDRERALRAMLDVSTKIQEKALKAALGIVRSDRDIAKSVSETLREHDGIMHLAEAVVQNAKESRLSRAADFLADENVLRRRSVDIQKRRRARHPQSILRQRKSWRLHKRYLMKLTLQPQRSEYTRSFAGTQRKKLPKKWNLFGIGMNPPWHG